MENYLSGQENGKKTTKIPYVDLSGAHPVVRIGLATEIENEIRRNPEGIHKYGITCSSVNG